MALKNSTFWTFDSQLRVQRGLGLWYALSVLSSSPLAFLELPFPLLSIGPSRASPGPAASAAPIRSTWRPAPAAPRPHFRLNRGKKGFFLFWRITPNTDPFDRSLQHKQLKIKHVESTKWRRFIPHANSFIPLEDGRLSDLLNSERSEEGKIIYNKSADQTPHVTAKIRIFAFSTSNNMSISLPQKLEGNSPHSSKSSNSILHKFQHKEKLHAHDVTDQ